MRTGKGGGCEVFQSNNFILSDFSSEYLSLFPSARLNAIL